MNIEDIILTIIIAIAVLYSGRRIYLILFSKKLPKCTGCMKSCSKNLSDTTNTSDEDHDCR